MSKKYILDLGITNDSDIHPYHEIENLIIEYLDLLKYYKSFLLVNKYYHKLITSQESYVKFKKCSDRHFQNYFAQQNNLDILLVLFRNACVFGYLDVAKYLHQFYKFDIHYCDNLFFIESCQCGRLEIVKFLLDLDNNIYSNPIGRNGFMASCKNNHMDVAKYLYQFALTKYNSNEVYHLTFEYACKNCYLDLAKYIHYLDKPINRNLSSKYLSNLFEYCIDNNQLEISKWLYSLNNEIDTNSHQNLSFSKSCQNGNLETVKWIYQVLNDKIRLDPSPEILFQAICRQGHLEIVKFLFSKFNIDIHHDNEQAFHNACRNDNIEIAKWLYEISLNEGKPIDIRANNDDVFKRCTVLNHQEICMWLATLCDSYHIIISKKDECYAVFEEKIE